MWILRTLNDGEPEKTFRILAGGVRTIGRATGADFIVDAPLVSRVHCRVTALPGGEEIYASEIRSWTTLPLEPKEVHELGLRRWDKIQEERVEVAARLGFADPIEAIAQRRASGKDTPASAEALVARGIDELCPCQQPGDHEAHVLEVVHERVRRRLGPHAVPEGSGAHAVDDRDLLEPRQRGILEIALQRPEGLIDSCATEVQR